MKELRIAGISYAEIGEKFGLSLQRIEQIVNRKPNKNVVKVYPNDLAPIRMSRNMTATEVAAIFGRSKAWLSKLEHGEFYISKDVYNKFLEIYNVDKIDGVRFKRSERDADMDLLKKENEMLKYLLSYVINNGFKED